MCICLGRVDFSVGIMADLRLARDFTRVPIPIPKLQKLEGTVMRVQFRKKMRAWKKR